MNDDSSRDLEKRTRPHEKYFLVRLLLFFPVVAALSLAALVLLPLILPLFAWALIKSVFSERRFKDLMKVAGRTLARRELRGKLSSGGSVIIESPHLASGITRAWWTPDHLVEIAPVSPATHDQRKDSLQQDRVHEWDWWCWVNYTSPESGKAFLMRVWNGSRLKKWVTRECPSVVVVQAWSGPIYAKHYRRPNAPDSAPPEPADQSNGGVISDRD
jgi:hypothetical protein